MASSVASAEAGFSLVELAIALAVLGVMLTGLLGPLQQLRTHQRQQDTRAALAAIRQGLLGYAMSHGRLPCPADPALADSHAQAGLACRILACPASVRPACCPGKTLGAPALDAWGHRYSYAVAAGTASLSANWRILRPAVRQSWQAAWYVHRLPAPRHRLRCSKRGWRHWVLSHGANGYGGWDALGQALPGASASSGEQLNIVTAGRDLGSNGAPKAVLWPDKSGRGRCDDVLEAIPAPLLLHALVSAGRLP